MPANEYHFLTPWFIPGATVEQVWALVSDATTFPAWWRSVFLEVSVEHEAEDGLGVGKRLRYHTKGYLPYHLYWTGTVTALEPPTMIEIGASGDFNGVGRWTLSQRENGVYVALDWRITVDQWFVKKFAFIMNPLFQWNHRWAMARGEEGLIVHLGRQKLKDASA